MRSRSLALSLSRSAHAGAAMLVCIFLAALLADRLAPYDYAAQDLDSRFAGSSWAHPLGTDQFGRDLLSRLVFGARISLAVGVLATGLALVVGVPLGAAAGYLGGPVDLALSWLMDLLQAFPALLLAIAVASALGPSIVNATLAIALIGVPSFGRLVRAAVLGARSADYVLAARVLGAGATRIVSRHILPNVLDLVIVRTTLGVGAAILTEAGLSFIGLGAQPPEPSWGAMLNDGRDYIRRAGGLVSLPGLCIMLTVLAFNLLGDGLRDARDPRLRR